MCVIIECFTNFLVNPYYEPLPWFMIYVGNMSMSGLPNMYTQSLRATGPRAEGVRIRQTTSGHVKTMAPPIIIVICPNKDFVLFHLCIKQFYSNNGDQIFLFLTAC